MLIMSSDHSNSNPAKPVGYKNPPIETRFKKGQSGNPSGRPRQPRRLADDLQRELARIVTVTINGKAHRLCVQRALLRMLASLGLNGDKGATQLIFGLARNSDPGNDSHPTGLEALIESEVERRIAARSGANDTEAVEGAQNNG
jgi:hypothetical protein